MQAGDLPAVLLAAVLAGVMMLDAIPLVGVLVPGDVAVLASVGASRPGGGIGALLAAVTGCLSGWSLSFLAGRHFGDQIRASRIGTWIGEPRWAAAERALGRGGGRMVLVAPFLPVLNALMPLAAGGLKMSYRRFVCWAALGSALWAGLYVLLGTAARSLGGFLPGESFAFLVTTVIGLLVGWIVLVAIRSRLRIAGGDRSPERAVQVVEAARRRAASLGEYADEHGRVGMGEVPGGRQQGERAGGGVLPKLRDRGRMRRISQFRPIPLGELGEARRIVPVPATQLGGGGNLAQPRVEGRCLLAQPPWPQSVDQHASAVGGVRVVVDPLNTRHHPSMPDVSGVSRTGRGSR